ncbi:hypothetical protein A45J_0013 [hot springs metagenome]|uniref:Uncharacterized protein n=3 Tax=hot springs metagenome TaxID=433727 RepID=A0A5J4KRG5_9ZZZZ
MLFRYFTVLSQDEKMQEILIQHFHPDVIMSEMKRRRMPPPLLSTADLAQILRVSVYDIYRKQQNNELGIPYIPLGQGRKQGKKYDPRDVEEYIRKKKISVVARPESLKRVKSLKKLEKKLNNSNSNGKGRQETWEVRG